MAKTKLNIPLLKELSEATGVSGFEHNIRAIVRRELKGYVDSIEVDTMGNLIAFKKGTAKKGNKKVMCAAHMDEIGFMVQHIDDKGFIRISPLGGFDPKTLSSQRVVIHGDTQDVIGVMGGKAIHMMKAEERKKMPEVEDFFIDTGLPKEEVEKLVCIGNPITRQRNFIEMGECVNGKSLDNRMLVFVLIETIKKIKKMPYDFYGVFTVQEEVGIRGAKVAVHSIQPDIGICLDVTLANDIPGSTAHNEINKLGGGTSIDVMNRVVIADPRIVKYFKDLAKKHKIPHQIEVLDAGGTDAWAFQLMTEGGCITGGISVPLRNMHQEVEMCHRTDIIATIDLLKLSLENMDKGTWTLE